MTQKKKKTKQKIIISVALSLTAVGGILYGLADRYLIEHVDTVVAAPVTASKSSTVTASATGSGTSTASTTSTTSSSSADSSSAAGTVTSDDWNYNSSDINISITKNETGSGSDKITYYVADIQLASSSNLLTAFAKNEFGTNITQDTSTIASSNNAIFAINGDYYGFRDDGVVIRNGVLYRDEPARDGLALFNDGTMKTYDEEETSADELLAEGVTNTFSFGPILVKDGVAVDNFDNVSIDTNFGNRSIDEANPRTGVGIISPNHYVFVVVDGRQENYSRGMTLNEFAQLFEDLGATDAYNLDGGGSSTMYFNGRVVNSPGSKGEERGVSDILFIAE
ncbi:phosphodiester glycosidase family protein [Paenibacillus pinistramenti]|uniref:phosphodiester glycosidase family protein n=1 Tax=Paenibacillus pinistramenti TaxID=1768003 RepID=UPI0011085721|nr:phosphodiester glycosidase family protein [Paenibacillus pinistramenti]